MVEEKPVERISLTAHVIDIDMHERQVIHIGESSLAVTHKPWWLGKVAKNGTISSRLLLLSEDEYGILLTTPKQGENKT